MKTQGQIRQQYKQVRYRARKKFLETVFKKQPHKCRYASRPSEQESFRVGLCLYGSMAEAPDWDVSLCDQEQAQRCEHFTPRMSSDEAKRRFDEFLSLAEEEGDPKALGAVAFHYPDVAALLWVLEPWKDGEGPEEESSDDSGGVVLQDPGPGAVRGIPGPDADHVVEAIRASRSKRLEREADAEVYEEVLDPDTVGISGVDCVDSPARKLREHLDTNAGENRFGLPVWAIITVSVIASVLASLVVLSFT